MVILVVRLGQDRFRDEGTGINALGGKVRMPLEGPVNNRGIRVHEQLGNVEPVAKMRLPRPVSAVTVLLAGVQSFDMDRELPARRPAHLDAVGFAVSRLIKQAQPQRIRVVRNHGKAHAFRVDVYARMDMHHVMTDGSPRPVLALMSAMLSAAAIRSASADCVSSPWRNASGS